MKWTEGPWTINPYDRCSVMGNEYGICDTRHKDGDERRDGKYNAQLIALSPEMAEIILEWHNRKPGDGAKWFDKMNAIALKLKEIGDE